MPMDNPMDKITDKANRKPYKEFFTPFALFLSKKYISLPRPIIYVIL